MDTSRMDEMRFELRLTIGDAAPAGADVDVAVFGDLDRTSVPEFLTAVRNALETCERVRVDISLATVIDSVALGALIQLHQSAIERNRSIEIVIGARYQRVLLETAGLYDYLTVTDLADHGHEAT